MSDVLKQPGGVFFNLPPEMVNLSHETKEPFHLEIKVPQLSPEHKYLHASTYCFLQREMIQKV